MNQFVEYASLYDLFYRDKDYESEVEYLKNVIKRYKPDTKTILDLGCGTGRHAMLLVREGYKLTGIDSSKKMLEQAQSNITTLPEEYRNNINFNCEDITRLRLTKKYDFIYSLFHVISYQTTNDAVISTFETVKNHLDPNGIFIFDVWYGPGVLTQKPEFRSSEYHIGESLVQRDARPTLMPNDNVVKIQYTVNIEAESRKIVEEHFVRYFFQPEIKLFLAKFGMEVIGVFDGFTDKITDETTWSATFITKNID